MQEAAAHAAVGDFRDAAERLRLVLLQDPAHADAATQLAEIEIDHALHANAVARLLGVLRHKPRYAPALAAMSRNCVMVGQLEEALTYARQACAQAPSDPGHRLQLGRVLLRMERFAAAREAIAPLLNSSRLQVRG